MNGGSPVWVDQPSTGGGHVIISVPVQLFLNSGSNNITFSAGQTSEFDICARPLSRLTSCVFSDYAADLDKIIVY